MAFPFQTTPWPSTGTGIRAMGGMGGGMDPLTTYALIQGAMGLGGALFGGDDEEQPFNPAEQFFEQNDPNKERSRLTDPRNRAYNGQQLAMALAEILGGRQQRPALTSYGAGGKVLGTSSLQPLDFSPLLKQIQQMQKPGVRPGNPTGLSKGEFFDETKEAFRAQGGKRGGGWSGLSPFLTYAKQRAKEQGIGPGALL